MRRATSTTSTSRRARGGEGAWMPSGHASSLTERPLKPAGTRLSVLSTTGSGGAMRAGSASSTTSAIPRVSTTRPTAWHYEARVRTGLSGTSHGAITSGTTRRVIGTGATRSSIPRQRSACRDSAGGTNPRAFSLWSSARRPGTSSGLKGPSERACGIRRMRARSALRTRGTPVWRRTSRSAWISVGTVRGTARPASRATGRRTRCASPPTSLRRQTASLSP
mmetsp:Transcript_49532/g.116767  ORF Transcript_49532/g.116767 Transcript_49532/m.116767 type:complete len:222 (+) Transcript_49532:1598-2263(+)